MTDTPRVSIGLPVYDGENFLGKAIESILSQTYGNFELVISDNGSTDNTETISRNYARKDSRIRYYRTEINRGASWNYNHVYQLSRGEYFKWAAHDDIIDPTYAERCVKILDKDPSIALCYGKTKIIDEYGNDVGDYQDNMNLPSEKPSERFEICLKNSAKECNAVFGFIRSCLLKKTSLIGNYVASDYILLAELALLGKFYEIPEHLFFRRDYPGTSGRSNRNANDVALWFDPKRKRKFLFPKLKHFYEYTRCIKNAELDKDKIRFLISEMGSWLWWRKIDISRELLSAVIYLFHPRERICERFDRREISVD